MYGLPKIHKQIVPLRPNVSITGSAQHQLVQWLTSVIDPVLSLYFAHCISDSFTFAHKIRTFDFLPSVFLCSYDICSLFSNVPLTETIEICADALYNGELTPPHFPRAIFDELMQTATSSVEFGFNNIMHRQIDGVARAPLLVHLLLTFLSAIAKLCYSKESRNLVCIIDSLMIPLQLSTMKTNVMSFSPI